MSRLDERSSSSIPRRDFLLLMGAASAAAGCRSAGVASLAAPRKPNVIFIYADDLGFADLGCQGARDVITPNIDSIAAGGARFTSGYVSAPVCSPSRAGLLTGRYQTRFGHEFNLIKPNAQFPEVGLPVDQRTIADVLSEQGYATAAVGKWHLGDAAKYHPLRRGFQEYFGFLGGAHKYINWTASDEPILRGAKPVKEREHLTAAFGREAAAFIARRQHAPFFLYLAFNAVHLPLAPQEFYLRKFDAITDPRRRKYAAALSEMDDAIGVVLRRLRELGLERDTLVFFASDNGGPISRETSGNGSSNNPLSGGKAGLREGGIRVPFLLRWPARIKPGTVCDLPAITFDVFATAAAAGGASLPALATDGVDLLPYLQGAKTGSPHDSFCWRYGQQQAVRQGDWKLVVQRGQPQLFNLAEDTAEANDLSARSPDRLAALQKTYGEWNREMMPPRWINLGDGKTPAARTAAG